MQSAAEVRPEGDVVLADEAHAVPRNASDEMLKGLAARGGLVALHFGQGMYNPRFFEWSRKRAGRPFYDASDVPTRQAAGGIEEIDRRLRLSYEREPAPPPDDILEPLSRFVEVIDYRTEARRTPATAAALSSWIVSEMDRCPAAAPRWRAPGSRQGTAGGRSAQNLYFKANCSCRLSR